MKHISRIYAPNISPNSAYFASKSSAYFKKILRYKPASLDCDPRARNSLIVVTSTMRPNSEHPNGGAQRSCIQFLLQYCPSRSYKVNDFYVI